MVQDPKAAREARATTRLALIRQGKRITRADVFPGLGIAVQLAVLSCSEVQECYAEASKRLAALGLELNGYTLEVFNDECATQVLYRAVRTEDDAARRLAESPEDLRDNTTVDERAALFERYRGFQHAVDPDPAQLTDETLRELLDLVKKKDAIGLAALGSGLLASFILSTASPQPT